MIMKKGDSVKILSGKWKGTTGKVVKVYEDDADVKFNITTSAGEEKSVTQTIDLKDLKEIMKESKRLREEKEYVRDLDSRIHGFLGDYSGGNGYTSYHDASYSGPDSNGIIHGKFKVSGGYDENKYKRDAAFDKTVNKLRNLGAKNIKVRRSEAAVYFDLDVSRLVADYQREKQEAEDRYNSQLNSLDIDQYKPTPAILDKLTNYRDRGSRVNVKAASLDKRLTYYYGAKIIGWNDLASDIRQAIMNDYSISYEQRKELEDLLNAIGKRVEKDSSKQDTRSKDEIEFQSFFKKAYDLLKHHNIRYNFKNVRPKIAELEKDYRNGRCWTIAYELTFPDFENRSIRFCHHTNEGGGDYGWGYSGAAGDYGKRQIEDMIMRDIRDIANIRDVAEDYEIVESFDENEEELIEIVDEDFDNKLFTLRKDDYIQNLELFVEDVEKWFEEHPGEIYEFKFDEEGFRKRFPDYSDRKLHWLISKYYNDLTDLVKDEFNIGYYVDEYHSNDEIAPFKYVYTIEEKDEINEDIVEDKKEAIEVDPRNIQYMKSSVISWAENDFEDNSFKNKKSFDEDCETKFAFYNSNLHFKTLWELYVKTVEELRRDINIEEYVEMNEDTVKISKGKWTNKGDSGETHGTFRTKKAADAQRKSMFANGYKVRENVNAKYRHRIIKEDLVSVKAEEDPKDIFKNYVYIEDIDGEKIPSWILLDKLATAENLSNHDLMEIYYQTKTKYKLFSVEAPSFSRLIIAAPEIKIEQIQEDFADYLMGRSVVTEISKPNPVHN